MKYDLIKGTNVQSSGNFIFFLFIYSKGIREFRDIVLKFGVFY